MAIRPVKIPHPISRHGSHKLGRKYVMAICDGIKKMQSIAQDVIWWKNGLYDAKLTTHGEISGEVIVLVAVHVEVLLHATDV